MSLGDQVGLGWPGSVSPDERGLGWPSVSVTDEPEVVDATNEDAVDDAALQSLPDASEAGPREQLISDEADDAAPAEPAPDEVSDREDDPAPETAFGFAAMPTPDEDGSPEAESEETPLEAAEQQAMPDASEADRRQQEVSDETPLEPPATLSESDAVPVDDDDLPHLEETPIPAVPRETTSMASLPAPPATRVMVVANQKGGVGKTTTAVNLAAALAMGGLRVLVVDLDPQGNASTALGVDHGPGTPGSYEVLIEGARMADLIQPSPEADGLTVLPATIDLAAAEIELVSTVARENKLAKALRAYLRGNEVDYVFLDCPPSLGLLTLNALVAAQEILIPIQCEYYALEGVSQLVNTIDLVKGELNDELELSTVLLTMFDARTRLAAQVTDEVRTHFAEQTLQTVIPRSVRISEAPSYGQTVLTYHPESVGAVCYFRAAEEIARRGAIQEDDA